MLVITVVYEYALLFLLPAIVPKIVHLEVVAAFPILPVVPTHTTTSTSIMMSSSAHSQRQKQMQHPHHSLFVVVSSRQQTKGTAVVRLSSSTSSNGGETDSHGNSNTDESPTMPLPPQSQTPTYGLYEVQEEMLIQRGIYEEALMSHTKSTPLLHIVPPLVPAKRKNSGTAATKGFGASTKKAKSSTTSTTISATANTYSNTDDAKHYASILRTDGLVRIDNIIPHNVVDDMKEFVMKLRQEATEDVLRQQQTGPRASGETRFADVLLRKNRCDLKIPIGYNDTIVTPVVSALYHALCVSPVSETMAQVYRPSMSSVTTTSNSPLKSKKIPAVNNKGGDGDSDAVLYELSCLISDYGSHRQVIHPDNPFRPSTISNDISNNTNINSVGNDPTTVPTLLTCFIALQDILDVEMGPTIFLPKTHTQHAHERFAQDAATATTTATMNGITTDQVLSPKDILLRDSPSVIGTLTKGYVLLNIA